MHKDTSHIIPVNVVHGLQKQIRCKHHEKKKKKSRAMLNSIYLTLKTFKGFPSGISGKEHVCQSRRHKRLGFEPWVGKIPWRKAWQPTPVFLPGESP